MAAPISLSNADARRLFLHRHRLAEAPQGRPGRDALADLIHGLGFVQVDSINTVARAHDLILFARQQSYRPRDLRALVDRRRQVFEHWTHDASAIPVEFWPHWRHRFRRQEGRLRKMWGLSRRPGFEEELRPVLEHIETHGPVLAREMGGDAPKKAGGWWDWHPSKTALEFLWHTGQLAVTRREGFQKVYDLAHRVIPEDHFAAEVEEAAFIDWACNAALDRLGFATTGEIAAFWALVGPEEAKAWAARNAGDLAEVQVACAGGATRRVLARPDIAEAVAAAPEPTRRLRVLSPFDPALRDRNRAERLFGFRYRIEVFVPEARRIYGYYVFPLLEGDRLVGRIDMKCQRDAGALTVRALWPERGVRFGKGRVARLEAELERLRIFTGMDRVSFADGWLRAPVSS